MSANLAALARKKYVSALTELFVRRSKMLRNAELRLALANKLGLPAPKPSEFLKLPQQPAASALPSLPEEAPLNPALKPAAVPLARPAPKSPQAPKPKLERLPSEE